MRSPRRMRSRNLIAGVVGVALFCWFILLILLNTVLDDSKGGSAPFNPEPRKMTQQSILCDEKHAGGIGLKDRSNIRRLEQEKNQGWNHTNMPTRILTLGTHGYIKRDLPVYQEAFSNKMIQVLPRPSDGRFSEDKDYDSLLCLSFTTDSCLSKEDFGRIPKGKKVNRIKSLREVLWSKNSFCETLSVSTAGFAGSDFFFPCWVLPEQYDKLVGDSNRLKIKRWISKPRALGAGMGITIIDNIREIKRSSSHVIQEYMQKPHLLKGADGQLHKWDMRTYVLVTSVTPLRAYVYQRGLIRLATSPYSEDCKSNNQTACLTNTSINKKMVGAKLKDITWSFQKLKDYLGELAYSEMFTRMQRAIGMTLLAAQPAFAREWEGTGDECDSCYQLLGVDVIFDDKLRAKVIECNGEPSMQTTSGGKTHYDITKKNMIRDLVNLVFQEKSAVPALTSVFGSKASQCKSPAKLRKGDVSYLLDMFRELKDHGEFAPVYPNAAFSDEYLGFIQHMASSSEVSRSGQKKINGLAASHRVFSDILASEVAASFLKRRKNGAILSVEQEPMQGNARPGPKPSRERISDSDLDDV